MTLCERSLIMLQMLLCPYHHHNGLNLHSDALLQPPAALFIPLPFEKLKGNHYEE